MLALRLFARFGYVPTMLAGLNLLAVYVVAGGYSIIWIGALLAVAVVLSLLSERVLPFEQSWNNAHSDVPKDVAHGVVYELSNINAILIMNMRRCIGSRAGSASWLRNTGSA